jgi:hypothetical protein
MPTMAAMAPVAIRLQATHAAAAASSDVRVCIVAAVPLF